MNCVYDQWKYPRNIWAIYYSLRNSSGNFLTILQKYGSFWVIYKSNYFPACGSVVLVYFSSPGASSVQVPMVWDRFSYSEVWVRRKSKKFHVSDFHILIVLSFSRAPDAIIFSEGWQALHRTTSGKIIKFVAYIASRPRRNNAFKK